MKRKFILKTMFFWKFSPAEYMYNQIVTRDLKESTTLNFIAMATKHGWNICVHVYSMKFSGNHWKQSSNSHLERKCKIGLKKIKVVPHPRLLPNWIWQLFLKTWEENPLKDDNLCMFIPERALLFILVQYVLGPYIMFMFKKQVHEIYAKRNMGSVTEQLKRKTVQFTPENPHIHKTQGVNKNS